MHKPPTFWAKSRVDHRDSMCLGKEREERGREREGGREGERERERKRERGRGREGARGSGRSDSEPSILKLVCHV